MTCHLDADQQNTFESGNSEAVLRWNCHRVGVYADAT